MILIISFYIK